MGSDSGRFREYFTENERIEQKLENQLEDIFYEELSFQAEGIANVKALR